MTWLGRIAAAALAIMLVATSTARPQEPTPPANRPLPRLGEAWHIEKIADVPPDLKRAIDRARCQLDEFILHEIPIEIIRLGRPATIALVTCGGVISWYGRAFMLERDPSVEPKLMLFPTLASPSGVGTTDSVGVLGWDASTKTLTATQGNDVGGGDEIRHTYSYDPGQAGLFRLIRIETRKCCQGTAGTAWSSVWEAPAWPILRR
jgi:hypothetical protein